MKQSRILLMYHWHSLMLEQINRMENKYLSVAKIKRARTLAEFYCKKRDECK